MADSPDVTLDSSGKASTATHGPLNTGSYAFHATYSGDSNYAGLTGACEPFAIAQGQGTVVTNVTLDANGKATSASHGPLGAGSYAFQATYNGDANYTSATGACEPFTVLPEPAQGCIPGFWKNHTSLWDQPTDAISQALASAIASKGAPYSGNGTSGSAFFGTIGIPGGPYQALSSSVTLLGALNLGGGGFQALARHGAAALLSSVDVSYPYSAAQVLVGVHNAYNDGKYNEVSTAFPDGILTDLSAANNLDESACGQTPPTK